MSQLIFGLPFENGPSKQSILPYMTDSGRVYGFFPIATTLFNGTETSFSVDGGNQTVELQTVTLPPINQSNSILQPRVQQFMAAYFPINQEGIKPWTRFSSLIDASSPIKLGQYSWYSQPLATFVEHFSRGIYVDALRFRLDPSVPIPTTPSGPTLGNTTGTLTWAASADPQAWAPDCAFMDFNWVQLFNAQFNPDPNNLQTNAPLPLAITSITNPPGGYFKAVVIGGAMGSDQMVLPGGGIIYNTVRIIKLQDPPAGSYAFTFTISYQQGGSLTAQKLTTTATLNLTII
jgi:hypothetical protein